MGTKPETSSIASVSADLDSREHGPKMDLRNVEFEPQLFSPSSFNNNLPPKGSPTKDEPPFVRASTSLSTTSDTESGIFSVESELCVEHESELDWFCISEQKMICSHCAIVGSCHGHSVTQLTTRVTAVRVSALSEISRKEPTICLLSCVSDLVSHFRFRFYVLMLKLVLRGALEIKFYSRLIS